MRHVPAPGCPQISRYLLYAIDRFRASARAGCWFGGLRRAARVSVRPIDQDGVLLLMPREPSLSFVYVPLLALAAAAGAALAVFG